MEDIVIASVGISEGAIEIGFLETRDQTERAGLMKNLVIDRKAIEPEMEELFDLLYEIVDKGLLEIRNPSPSLDPRKRIGRKAPVETLDE
jgi:hypothetical protein